MTWNKININNCIPGSAEVRNQQTASRRKEAIKRKNYERICLTQHRSHSVEITSLIFAVAAAGRCSRYSKPFPTVGWGHVVVLGSYSPVWTPHAFTFILGMWHAFSTRQVLLNGTAMVWNSPKTNHLFNFNPEWICKKQNRMLVCNCLSLAQKRNLCEKSFFK